MDYNARIKQLEDDLLLIYEELDQRVSRLEHDNSDSEYITVLDIVASIVIGVIQILAEKFGLFY